MTVPGRMVEARFIVVHPHTWQTTGMRGGFTLKWIRRPDHDRARGFDIVALTICGKLKNRKGHARPLHQP